MAARKTTGRQTKASTARKSPSRKKEAPAAKPRKSAIGISTWVSLILLAALIGTVVYLNRQEEIAAPAEDELGIEIEEVETLFTPDQIVTGIEVAAADGNPVALERGGESGWVLAKPAAAEADPAIGEAAASQVLALEIVNEIEDASDPSIFGLAEPSGSITVTFADGTTSTLAIGDLAPSGNGYYTLVDGERVFILFPDGIDALLSLVDFPPYLSTPTPTATMTATPLPTETPAPTAEATPTP